MWLGGGLGSGGVREGGGVGWWWVVVLFLSVRRPRCFIFFNDTATTEIYTNLNTLSLHDALP
eukprot:COSAG02_NODE_62086_length_267_cov_0.464286_1_plen_61_part_01